MSYKQPEALMLADALDESFSGLCGEAAAELRRLHAENVKLKNKVLWNDKGLAEWRDTALSEMKQAKAARATARIAITHLQKVLNGCKTHDEQQAADTAARDWLDSIGAEI